MESERIQVFVSYAHEDRRHLEQFRKHTADLRRNKMILFDDQEIQVGQQWKSTLGDKLNAADIVVLLVTVEFVASEFCYMIEFRRALERKSAGECIIVPVNLGPVDLARNDPLYALQHVPQGRSISEIRSGRASAWKQVAQVLRQYVDGLEDGNSPSLGQGDAEGLPSNVIPISRRRNFAINSSSLQDAQPSEVLYSPPRNQPASTQPSNADWHYLVDILRVTRFDGADWQSLAMSTGRLREALENGESSFGSLPARAQEVIDTLRRNLATAVNPSATQTSILAASAVCERLRVWLLDILTTSAT